MFLKKKKKRKKSFQLKAGAFERIESFSLFIFFFFENFLFFFFV